MGLTNFLDLESMTVKKKAKLRKKSLMLIKKRGKSILEMRNEIKEKRGKNISVSQREEGAKTGEREVKNETEKEEGLDLETENGKEVEREEEIEKRMARIILTAVGRDKDKTPELPDIDKLPG